MGSIEIRTCAEEQVVSSLRIEDCVHGILSRNTDWSRRQSIIHVGIIWRLDLEMILQDSVQCIVIAESDCRIRLEFHSTVKPVEIHSGNHRVLRHMVRLTAYNACKHGHFHLGKSLDLGLFLVRISPERIVGRFLLIKHNLHGISPINLICIRHEKGKYIVRRKAIS